MDALAAATASADAVGAVGGRFMLAGPTYAHGASLGFAGIDFYFAGRGGVLGPVDADVVTAAFAFFEPAYVRAQWEAGLQVLPPRDSAQAFADCCHSWAEEHVPDDLPSARLAELAGAAVAAARVAVAPVFAGWRALPAPDSPKAAATRAMNDLRELRMALHAAAVVAAGLSPLEALSHRSPGMAPMFGWAELADVTEVVPRWEAAEVATDLAMAHVYAALPEPERDELVGLANDLLAAV